MEPDASNFMVKIIRIYIFMVKIIRIYIYIHGENITHIYIYIYIYIKLNSVALVRERNIPTERPPPVGEVSANFCG